ncbi:hypothetical protein ACSSVY_004368 [Roseovarius sp. MBR-51]
MEFDTRRRTAHDAALYSPPSRGRLAATTLILSLMNPGRIAWSSVDLFIPGFAGNKLVCLRVEHFSTARASGFTKARPCCWNWR